MASLLEELVLVVAHHAHSGNREGAVLCHILDRLMKEPGICDYFAQKCKEINSRHGQRSFDMIEVAKQFSPTPDGWTSTHGTLDTHNAHWTALSWRCGHPGESGYADVWKSLVEAIEVER